MSVFPDITTDLKARLPGLRGRLAANQPLGAFTWVRDGGVPGVVVRLGRGFNKVATLSDHRVRAGAAALDVHVARAARDAGIAGLAFLSGIPGSVGGALRMNGGAYGGEIKG